MRKFFLSLLLIVAVCIFAFAQTTPIEPGGMTWGIILMVLGVIAGIIEIALRLLPTDRDWSLLNFILKIINAIVPNRAKSGIDGNDKAFFNIRKIKIKGLK